MTPNSDEIRQFREIYLVSNTPSYLHKRLRQLPAVQRLAESMSVDDLAREYKRYASAVRRTPDDLSTAYALLVAISFKEPEHAIPALRSLNVTKLEWARTLRDLAMAKTPSTQSIRIITPPTVSVSSDTERVKGEDEERT